MTSHALICLNSFYVIISMLEEYLSQRRIYTVLVVLKDTALLYIEKCF